MALKYSVEARELAECGGGLQVSSRDEFADMAGMLLGPDAAERRKRGAKAGEYIRSKLGATQKIYDHLFPAG